LHGPPVAVVVPEGLVDEVEVDVVQAEPFQGTLERLLGVGFAGGVLDPQLGSDE
jgi:hypothetical protein